MAKVTIEEQRQMGLRSAQQLQTKNFVAALPPDHQTAYTLPAKPEILPAYEPRANVAQPVTQHVEMRTSAVDRSKGFQIAITPVAFVLGFLAVLVSVAFESEFLSFASVLIFWLTFSAVYVAGWALTAVVTPEFVTLINALRQWKLLEREQFERWDHYRWQVGRPAPAPEQPKQLDPLAALVIGLGIGVPLAAVLMMILK